MSAFGGGAVVARNHNELVTRVVVTNDTAKNLAVNRHMGHVPELLIQDWKSAEAAIDHQRLRPCSPAGKY